MSDPIEDLEHFTTEGMTMNPLPASEVRRRGDRMRRRNHVLATVGGVAAVAIIAVPLALAAQGTDRTGTTPPPATQLPSPTRVTEIPRDFDLSTGMGDAGTAVTSDRDPVGTENVCGVGWYFVTDPTDQLSASMRNEGSEGGHDRHLVVFADEEEAAAAMDQFRAAPALCDGVHSDEGFSYEMFPASAEGSAADESSAWVQALHDEAGLTGEGYLTVAQRVGNAVLVDHAITGGAGDADVRQQGVENTLRRDARVVDAMAADFAP